MYVTMNKERQRGTVLLAQIQRNHGLVRVSRKGQSNQSIVFALHLCFGCLSSSVALPLAKTTTSPAPRSTTRPPTTDHLLRTLRRKVGCCFARIMHELSANGRSCVVPERHGQQINNHTATQSSRDNKQTRPGQAERVAPHALPCPALPCPALPCPALPAVVLE